MKKILILLMVVCLNGCSLLMIDSNLEALHGHSIQQAYNILGHPTASKPIPNGQVYYWRTDGIYRQSEPRVADSYITGDVSFMMRTHYTHSYSTYGGCIIKMKTNQYGIITFTDVSGYPVRACWYYADLLQDALR